MVRIDIRLGFALLALMVAGGPGPAAAEEPASDWLGSVGDFVRSGLGPPRTLEDIRHAEQSGTEAIKPVMPPATPVAVPAPAPVAEPEVVPILAAPLPPAEPEPKKAEVKPVAAPPMPVPEAKPKPVPEAKPKPVPVRVPVPPPPPEPLTSRIAATATLDQAVKLGGSADIYSVRIKKPVHN